MFKRIITITALTATFAAPAVSHAGTSCKSTWTKASGKISTFFVPVGKLVCKGLNTDDKAAAERCIADLEKFKSKADEMKQEWNRGSDGSWKIGPRALPHASPQTGKVSTERQFVGQPILGSSYDFAIERTGGKAKKDMIVEICFVDTNGNDRQYKKVRLNRSNTSFKQTFKGVAGTFALIHINNEKWGTNAHQYTIKGTAKGLPAKVKKAYDTLRLKKKISR